MIFDTPRDPSHVLIGVFFFYGGAFVKLFCL